MALVQPEVVQYLRDNLKNHPIDKLRAQLASEGVSDIDFDEALKQALRAPVVEPGAAPKKKSKAGVLLLAAGVGVVGVIGAIVALGSREPKEPAQETAATPASAAGADTEGAFVGHTGYVVRLPKDYMAVQNFRDRSKTVEIVHFCKVGTDPTNFLHEGLFGQLGIVRLEVQPSPMAGNLNGPDVLQRHVSASLESRGDKFATKPLQVGSMRGFQVIVELPNPGVEAYVLGDQYLYRFTAGQDDELYRELINSLRDVNAEH